ncbi:MAG: hypothetical protein CME06_00210 [Gemmatimonadetes bacterium]|nr:hypothetical protein [Gemmatimonadota bacterium]
MPRIPPLVGVEAIQSGMDFNRRGAQADHAITTLSTGGRSAPILLSLLLAVAGCGDSEPGPPFLRFHAADTLLAGAEPRPDSAELADDRRDAILIPAPSRWRARVTIPSGGRFETGLAAGGGSAQSSLPTIAFTFLPDAEGSKERDEYRIETPIDPAAQGWLDWTWDLSRHSRQSGWFEIDATPSPDGWIRLGDPLLVPATGRSPAPSLLLISIDTLRRDPIGRVTPNLDDLAERGWPVLTAIAPAPWTLPSHASLLTGLDPVHHGVVGETRRLPKGIPTLAKHFRDNGYRTLAMVSAPYLDADYGFAEGFDRYDDWTLKVSGHEASQKSGGAEKVVDQAIRWFSEYSAVPLFIFLHIWDPHYDYDPPPPFDTRFDPRYRGTVDGSFEALSADYAARDLEHVRALYDGEVAWTDTLMGHLLDRLDDLGRLDRTAVIVTSDHGDEFYEHGNKGHGDHLVPEVLEVPVIVGPTRESRLPVPGHRGRPHSLLDVAATTSLLVGLPPPAGIDGTPIGSPPDMPNAEAGVWSVASWGGRLRQACVTGRWAYIIEGSDRPPRLYDRTVDSGWNRDVAAEQSAALDAFASAWRHRMDGWPGLHLIAALDRSSRFAADIASDSPLGEAVLVRAGAGSSLRISDDRNSIMIRASPDRSGVVHMVFDPDYSADPFSIELRSDERPLRARSIRVAGARVELPPNERATITEGRIEHARSAGIGDVPSARETIQMLVRVTDRPIIVLARVPIQGVVARESGAPLDPELESRLRSLGYLD